VAGDRLHRPASDAVAAPGAEPASAAGGSLAAPHAVSSTPTSTAPDFVVITGLSGAGKSQAAKCCEDAGLLVVDNLPPALIPAFVALCRDRVEAEQRVAIVVDARGGRLFEDFLAALEFMRREDLHYRLLFLDASDQVLLRRFSETRRRHPLLSPPGGLALEQAALPEAIAEERRRLRDLRGQADRIIDTSEFSIAQLRQELGGLIAGGLERDQLLLSVRSFGYKYGVPPESDWVIDARCLENPYYVDHLRALSGLDDLVKEFVINLPATRPFLQRVVELIGDLVPRYLNLGKTSLTVAVGCTGGRHRSVVLAEELGRIFAGHPRVVVGVHHRDIDKDAPGG
jgi:UPF0042 nucleotide-binding protein